MRVHPALGTVLFSLFLAVAAQAADLRVATLNCFLLFDPAVAHSGKLDEERALTPEEYRRKIENLVSLTNGYEVVGLQETGGRDEIEALAKAGGYQWVFAKGKDTYTGEEVGALYKLPGWKITGAGRVGALDKLLSKHLAFTATKGSETIHFLVVHLIRPIGKQAEKHQRQLAAIAQWADGLHQLHPKDAIVILGDTNNDQTPLLSVGTEAGAQNQWAATHLTGKPFDRLIVINGSWAAVEVKRPPYGRKPNDLNKRLWTDHFLLGGTVTTGR
jgi:hypothetical protein